jgi:hypothetical protein
MMRSDEIPAAAPDFASLSFVHASLSFVHLQNGGHLRPSAGSRTVSGNRFRLAARAIIGKASAEAGRRAWVRPLVQHEHKEISGHLGYLRATRPEIAGGVVHHISAVSSRVTWSRCRPRRALLFLHVLLQRLARKRPSPTGKGVLTCGN